MEKAVRKELKKKKRIKLRNKKLIKQCPWLLPRNDWTDQAPKDYDYSWNELDALPEGWVRCFGTMLAKELNDILKKAKYERKFRILQAKEKFGEMRVYHNSVPSSIYEEINRTIDKYTYLSQNICAICGRPDVYMTYTGWDYPLCKSCYEKHINDIRPYELVISDKDPGHMADSYTIRRFTESGGKDFTYDISETAEKIRRQYAKRMARANRRLQQA